MKIETKYNIGDRVFLINSKKEVAQGKINNIVINVNRAFLAFGNRSETVIKYVIDGKLVNEDKTFSTKEDLLKSL